MKNIANKVLLFFCLIIISCNTQNDEIINIKTKLKESITSMQSTLDFIEEGFIMSPSISNKDGLLNDSDFEDEFKIKDSVLLKNEFEKEFEETYFKQDLQYPLSSNVLLRCDLYDLGKILGKFNYYNNNHDESPDFLVKKIVFINKTQKTNSFTTGDGSIELKTAKPIKNIEIVINYQFPTIKSVEFNEVKTKLNFEQENIFLKNITKNEATFIIPNTLKDRIVAVNGIYADGRVLKNIGETSRELPSEEELLFFRKMISFQKKAVDKIENNDFETLKELNDFLKKEKPKRLMSRSVNLKKRTITYHFSGNVKSIILFMKKKKNNFHEKTIIIEKDNFFNENDRRQKYFVIKDTITNRKGLVNVNGQLIIPAKYTGYSIDTDPPFWSY